MDFESVGAGDFKSKLRLYLDRVRSGESFALHRFGDTVAVIVPASDYLQMEADLVAYEALKRKIAARKLAKSGGSHAS